MYPYVSKENQINSVYNGASSQPFKFNYVRRTKGSSQKRVTMVGGITQTHTCLLNYSMLLVTLAP